MNPRPISALVLAGCLVLSSCSWFRKAPTPAPEEPEPATGQTELVGRISSVATKARFVLIQRYEKTPFTAGTILTTRGAPKRSANLLVTGESQGFFDAADLQSGTVEVGDAVFLLNFDPAPISN